MAMGLGFVLSHPCSKSAAWTGHRYAWFRHAFAFLLVASFMASVNAQQIGTNSTPGQTEGFKLTLNSQLVIEQVVVKDKSGNFVNGLTAKDFTVTEDGVPQAVKICDHQKFSNEATP